MDEFARHVKLFEIAGVKLYLLPRTAPFDMDRAVSDLSPENASICTKITSVSKREEFVRTRHLARFAAGVKEDCRRDIDGIPVWPTSLVGSISHSQGHVLVGVGKNPPFRSIGVDLEAIDRVKTHLAEKICRPDDQVFVSEGIIDLADVFIAKEALFKCHFQLGRRRFWFHDAEIIDAQVHDDDAFGSCTKLGLKVLIDTGDFTPAASITTVFVGKVKEPMDYKFAVGII